MGPFHIRNGTSRIGTGTHQDRTSRIGTGTHQDRTSRIGTGTHQDRTSRIGTGTHQDRTSRIGTGTHQDRTSRIGTGTHQDRTSRITHQAGPVTRVPKTETIPAEWDHSSRMRPFQQNGSSNWDRTTPATGPHQQLGQDDWDRWTGPRGQCEDSELVWQLRSGSIRNSSVLSPRTCWMSGYSVQAVFGSVLWAIWARLCNLGKD